MIDRGTVPYPDIEVQISVCYGPIWVSVKVRWAQGKKGHRLDIEPDGRYCRYYLANLVVGQIDAIPE
jgi:hypothetical protein